VKIIYDILTNYDHITIPHYVGLVGSVSRNLHHESSDVAVICIWKHVPCFEDLEEIKKLWKKTFRTDVDLIVMKYVAPS